MSVHVGRPVKSALNLATDGPPRIAHGSAAHWRHHRGGGVPHRVPLCCNRIALFAWSTLALTGYIILNGYVALWWFDAPSRVPPPHSRSVRGTIDSSDAASPGRASAKLLWCADKPTLTVLAGGLLDRGWTIAASIDEAEIVMLPALHRDKCVGARKRCNSLSRSGRLSNKAELRLASDALLAESTTADATTFLTPSGVKLDFEVGPEQDHAIMPEGYVMYTAAGRAAFVRAAARELSGASHRRTWLLKAVYVHKGEGLTLIGSAAQLQQLSDEVAAVQRAIPPMPHTPTLRNALLTDSGLRYVVEIYMVRPMLLPAPPPRDGTPRDRSDRRKFHVRSYVLVASVRPPLVFYHDGYVGIADSKYTADNFADGVVHVTNRHHGARAPDAVAHVAWLERELRVRFPDHADPMAYVRCQMERQAAIVFASAADDVTLEVGPPDRVPNGVADRWALYGVDYFIDADARVWLNEANIGPELKVNDSPVQHSIISALADGVAAVLDALRDQQLALDASLAPGGPHTLGGVRPGGMWPLPGVTAPHLKPVVIGDSTAAPALPSCRSPAADVPAVAA